MSYAEVYVPYAVYVVDAEHAVSVVADDDDDAEAHVAVRPRDLYRADTPSQELQKPVGVVWEETNLPEARFPNKAASLSLKTTYVEGHDDA